MTRWKIIVEESGQATIIVALCMVVLIAFLGLSIDVGHLRLEKRNLQKAADAAALAAGLEIRVCGTTPNCGAMTTAATKALVENGFTGSTLITNCSSAAGSGLTLMVSNPTCVNGTNDPNHGKTNYVEVEVSNTVRTYFSRIVGYDKVPIKARAEAARGLGGPCIYALDPSGSGAITVGVALLVQSTCGIVDESSSSSALVCGVGLGIIAPSISVTGKTASLLCFSTPVKTGVPVPTPADPLAYLPAPSTANDACGTSTSSPYTGSSSAVNIILGGNVVFNPGVYCGGISFTAALLSNITFNPGIYILRQGPGLLGIPSGGLNITVTLLSSITGKGVMFYNEGPVGSLAITAPALLGLSNVNLSAATTGEYGGVLFFQAHGVSTSGVFVANLLQGSKFNGAIYMPDALVSYGVGAVSSDYNILVAKDINFSVTALSTFGNNYATLQSGSPLGGDNTVLVQ